jgi:hypothetical protein
MREKCLKDARDELEIQVKSNLDDLLKISMRFDSELAAQ